jgi:hypothetical protein
MEPNDYNDAPVRKVLHFIRSVRLTEGKSRWGSTMEFTVQGPDEPCPTCYIHTN